MPPLARSTPRRRRPTGPSSITIVNIAIITVALAGLLFIHTRQLSDEAPCQPDEHHHCHHLVPSQLVQIKRAQRLALRGVAETVGGANLTTVSAPSTPYDVHRVRLRVKAAEAAGAVTQAAASATNEGAAAPNPADGAAASAAPNPAHPSVAGGHRLAASTAATRAAASAVAPNPARAMASTATAREVTVSAPRANTDTTKGGASGITPHPNRGKSAHDGVTVTAETTTPPPSTTTRASCPSLLVVVTRSVVSPNLRAGRLHALEHGWGRTLQSFASANLTILSDALRCSWGGARRLTACTDPSHPDEALSAPAETTPPRPTCASNPRCPSRPRRRYSDGRWVGGGE